MKKLLLNLLRMILLFCLVGFLYVCIELCFRHYSHISMFYLAGFLGVFCIDMPNNIYSFDLDYRLQVLISTILCTLGEGLCGLYVNVYKGWNVWDYTSLWGNFFWNQCNIFFVGAWILLIAFLGIFLADWFNFVVFKMQPKPYYRIGKWKFDHPWLRKENK